MENYLYYNLIFQNVIAILENANQMKNINNSFQIYKLNLKSIYNKWTLENMEKYPFTKECKLFK